MNESAILRERIVLALKTVYDPEIPVDIYELGLIYGIDVSPERDVVVQMTLTAPACPAAEMLPPEVEQKVASVEGVASAKVEIVWEPPWNKDMMSEAARLHLGFF
jgi:FeS assembly SUF system protein